jgi:hypothetical protein
MACPLRLVGTRLAWEAIALGWNGCRIAPIDAVDLHQITPFMINVAGLNCPV